MQSWREGIEWSCQTSFDAWRNIRQSSEKEMQVSSRNDKSINEEKEEKVAFNQAISQDTF